MNTPQGQGDADPDIPTQGNDPEVGRVETVNPEEEDSEEYEVYTGIPIRHTTLPRLISYSAGHLTLYL